MRAVASGGGNRHPDHSSVEPHPIHIAKKHTAADHATAASAATEGTSHAAVLGAGQCAGDTLGSSTRDVALASKPAATGLVDAGFFPPSDCSDRLRYHCCSAVSVKLLPEQVSSVVVPR